MITLSVAVASGGAIGALLRYFICQKLNARFPWGTFLVNVLGAFLLGWLIAEERREILNSFVGTGFLGALTTFSTLQYEAVSLYKKSQRSAIYYLFSTYTLGLLAAWTGFMIAAKL